MTDLPALASRYAVISPAIPAPTTQTSALADSGGGGYRCVSTCSFQLGVVCPSGGFIALVIRRGTAARQRPKSVAQPRELLPAARSASTLPARHVANYCSRLTFDFGHDRATIA